MFITFLELSKDHFALINMCFYDLFDLFLLICYFKSFLTHLFFIILIFTIFTIVVGHHCLTQFLLLWVTLPTGRFLKYGWACPAHVLFSLAPLLFLFHVAKHCFHGAWPRFFAKYAKKRRLRQQIPEDPRDFVIFT